MSFSVDIPSSYAKILLETKFQLQVLCQNIVGNKISASGVSPKWVKSNRRRKKEKRKQL